MQYFIISLIAGFCLLLLLLTVFFTAGKKNKKQYAADLQLVQSCGDEGLLRLYQQAESENERDGIVEFIKEKLTREEQGSADSSFNLTPAGNLDVASAPEGEPAQQREAADSAPRRSVPGVSGVAAANSPQADSSPTIVTGNTVYGEPGETHMLALETVNWQAIEEEMQQRREEEARIMAQNYQIQEVFSKIREVEERLAVEPPAENKR